MFPQAPERLFHDLSPQKGQIFGVIQHIFAQHGLFSGTRFSGSGNTGDRGSGGQERIQKPNSLTAYSLTVYLQRLEDRPDTPKTSRQSHFCDARYKYKSGPVQKPLQSFHNLLEDPHTDGATPTRRHQSPPAKKSSRYFDLRLTPR
jgi:hypothetical protein